MTSRRYERCFVPEKDYTLIFTFISDLLPSCDLKRQARAWYLGHWTYLFNHSSSVGVLRSYSGSICWWWTSVSGPESPSIHLGDREGQNESAFRTFFCTSSRPLTSIGNIQQGFDVGQDLKLRIKLTCFLIKRGIKRDTGYLWSLLTIYHSTLIDIYHECLVTTAVFSFR